MILFVVCNEHEQWILYAYGFKYGDDVWLVLTLRVIRRSEMVNLTPFSSVLFQLKFVKGPGT